ncbi:MAG TPA: pantetheine-phosphate adenylyltransferase [Gammaproteobacteria bacterium]|nr:pantetheine-phosphate adenylyltransferase [Gammaproteobacteria bacterium]
MKTLKTNAFFPGTFDPVTLGHEDLIQRAAKMFQHLIVAVTTNPEKQPLLSISERIKLIQTSCQHLRNVSVVEFNGLLVDFVSPQPGPLIIRGVRSVNDYIYEHDRAMMNQSLKSDLETIFLPSQPKFSSLSSTLVREIAKLKGDLNPFVSPHVREKLNHYGFKDN